VLIISNTENSLQEAVCKLKQIKTEHGLTICKDNKLMSFKEREPVRSKLVIGTKITEQLNSFNCFGNLIFYEKEVDVDTTLNN
jgi:hypothetical protein